MIRVRRTVVTNLRHEQRALVATMEAADFTGPTVDPIHDRLLVIEEELTTLIRS